MIESCKMRKSPEIRHFPGFIFAQNPETAVLIRCDRNCFYGFIGVKIVVDTKERKKYI